MTHRRWGRYGDSSDRQRSVASAGPDLNQTDVVFDDRERAAPVYRRQSELRSGTDLNVQADRPTEPKAGTSR